MEVGRQTLRISRVTIPEWGTNALCAEKVEKDKGQSSLEKFLSHLGQLTGHFHVSQKIQGSLNIYLTYL